LFHLTEYQKQPSRLAHRLPWAIIAAPGVVLNKTGSFQITAKFFGPDLNSSTIEELDTVTAQVNNAIMRLGSGWAYFIEAQRRKYNFYPDCNWPNKASELVDNERRETFLSGDHYLSRYYLTFSYLPPTEKSQKLSGKFLNEKSIDYLKDLKSFQDECRKIVDILNSTLSIEILDDEETLTYLHSTVSTTYHPVKCPSSPFLLDYLITDDNVIGGLQPKLGECFLGVISLFALPSESYPQILKDLDSLGCEYRWSTRFICLDKQDALKEINKYSRYWFAKRHSLLSLIKHAFLNDGSDAKENHEAITRSEECDAIAEAVSSSNVSAGYYTSCVVLWDKNVDRFNQKISDVQRVINTAGFIAKKETFNAVQSWLGSLPGHCWANIRRPLISSVNLCHLIPISMDWPGQEKDHHLDAPPLFFARTSENTPFRFALHVGDVGHTMIVGPTGSGKSALLSFMATQFLRYSDAHVYIFDKDNSAMATTYLMGGDHYNLGQNSGLSFQPLADIENENERAWALEWLVDILTIANVTITPKHKTELWDALSNLATSPAHQRTMTGLYTLTQDKELREALNLYTLAGSYGQLLDAKETSFRFSSWMCFEMNHLMQYLPGATAPVLTFLFHALDKVFTGKPSVLILDECWVFLSNPLFSAKIREWLKTLRKKNVCVIFATQSLADMTTSVIFHTLIESCPTRIFLPNRRAMEAELLKQYKGFGLNEKQVKIISQAVPKREYYCQSDIGNRLFELHLKNNALTICASSTKSDLALVEELKESKNNGFLEKFLKAKGGTS